MVPPEIWRARIGLFCASRSGRVSRSRQVHHGNPVGKVTITDFVYVCCCLATLVVLVPFATRNEEEVSHGFYTAADVCVLVVLHSGFLIARLLRSGDIELNPGPNHTNGKEGQGERTEPTDRSEERFNCLDSKLSEVLKVMQSVNHKMSEQSERLQRIEQEQTTLKETLNTVNKDISKMKQDMTTKHCELEQKCDALNNSVTDLRDEVDRLESFSRRNNIKLFGVAEQEDGRTEDCAKVVKEVLSEFLPEEDWKDDVIERAHRLGQHNPRYPSRPIIAKFQRWGDMMSLMRNREAKERMKESGLRVSQDLTRRQAATLRELRQDGKTGYFVNGKLRISNRPTEGANRPSDRDASPVGDSPASPRHDSYASAAAATPTPSSSQVSPHVPTTASDRPTGSTTQPRTRSSVTGARQSSLKEAWTPRGGSRSRAQKKQTR